MAYIVAEGLYYRYPGSSDWSLKDVTIRISKGRIVVAGDTGSGKSTLLRALAGILEGVYGGELKGRVERLGNIVMVPQNFDAYILLPTPRQEIAYMLENRGLPLQEVEGEVYRIAGILGIKDVLDRPVDSLSMGERQRVAVASALAVEPDVLLLDEPLAYVDPGSIQGVLGAVDEYGVDSIVVAEHRLYWLRGWLRRIVVMEDGYIIHDGPPEGAMPGIPLHLRLQLMEVDDIEAIGRAKRCLSQEP